MARMPLSKIRLPRAKARGSTLLRFDRGARYVVFKSREISITLIRAAKVFQLAADIFRFRRRKGKRRWKQLLSFRNGRGWLLMNPFGHSETVGVPPFFFFQLFTTAVSYDRSGYGLFVLSSSWVYEFFISS